VTPLCWGCGVREGVGKKDEAWAVQSLIGGVHFCGRKVGGMNTEVGFHYGLLL